MHVHGSDVAAVLVGPYGVQQGLPGIYPVGISHEKFDDIKFLGGQIGQLSGAVCVPGVQIQRDGADGEHIRLSGGTGTGASKQRPDPGLQLQNVEGLGHIIVGTLVKTQELVHVLYFCGKKDDGDIGKLTDLGAGGQSVHYRHHDIQHDQIDLGIPGQLNGLQSVAAGDDLVAIVLQIEANTLDQQRFVVNNENFHLNLLLR